jgi:putative transposase
LDVFREVKGLKNYNKLVKYLKDNEQEAFELGFFKGEDNQLKLPSKRTINDILKQISRKDLLLIAKKIVEFATRNEKILDIGYVLKKVTEQKEKQEKKKAEAVDLTVKFMKSNFNIPLKHNAKFDNEMFIRSLAYISKENDYAHGGAKTFSYENPGKTIPSGDTLLYNFAKLSFDDVTKIYDGTLNHIVEFAKTNYNLFKERKFDVAIDCHQICYFGKDLLYTRGGKHDRGTSKFFEYAVCSIIDKGLKLIVCVIPMTQFDKLSVLVDDILTKVKKVVKINRVLCDRAFNGIEVIRALNRHQVQFLMPMVRSETVKDAYEKAQYCDARVFDNFRIGNKNNYVKVNLIVVKDKRGDHHSFICNFPVHEVIAYRLFKIYSKRWNIETSFRSLTKDFRARTTSKSIVLRLLYFLFSCCLYNLWTIVNLVVSLVVNGRVPGKPLITGKQFIRLFSFLKKEYFDNGG